MKHLFSLFVLLIALGSCKDHDCCDDPVDQAWLDTNIADIGKSDIKQYFYIQKAEYEGSCVVFVNNCCPMCNTVTILYKCDGTKIENADLSKIRNAEILWRPYDFACQN